MNISKLFRRFWAYCFDIMIVCGINSGILLLTKVLDTNNTLNAALQELRTVFSKGILVNILNGQAYYIALFFLSYGLLFLIYEIIFLSSKLSATPGKLILRLEVACGNKVNFFKVFTRSLLKVIATLVFPLTFIAFLISACTHTKQTLHDKLANTYVITVNTSNRGTTPHMSLNEFFEEMTSRGLRMYSEQKALAEEIYGSPVIDPAKSNETASLVGILVLVFSIILNLSLLSYSYPDIKNYVQDFTLYYTQKL
ncbi:RDD family protein [Acetivibrio cellulolyticus]|uniref:RDD family protein n=1 Tax=Acetivibrio cellulolyticus TaxID=35830 RepID=UPI0001E2EBFE|nr:RDD family protein [Acetivibrio cellulolyticus]